MSEIQTDHARGCQGREYTCTCGYDDQREWQPIETAPRDRTEILMFREDCGVFLARWISPSEFLIDGDPSDHFSNEDSWYEPDWFGADFVSGYRVTNDGEPTHWQPLPSPPEPLPTPSIQVAE